MSIQSSNISIESSFKIYDNYYVYDKKTQNEFIDSSLRVHRGFYNYDKVFFINRESDVIVTCPNHGDFHIKPKRHYRGVGCNKCKC